MSDERPFPECACQMQLEQCNLDNPNCPRFHDATWHELAFGLLDAWEPVSMQELIAAEEAYHAQLPPLTGDGPLGGPKRPETPPDYTMYQACELPRRLSDPVQSKQLVVYRFDCWDAIEDCFVTRVAGPFDTEQDAIDQAAHLRFLLGQERP